MAEYKFGFIGCGNMGGALLRAVARTIPSEQILVSDYDGNKVIAFADELEVVASDNAAIAEKAEFIVLGVKPQAKEALAVEIKSILAARKDKFTLITMLAGTDIKTISALFGDGRTAIIRIMPNMPASVGEGMILFSPNENCDEATVEEFKDSFVEAGNLMSLPERLIDAGSAVSGCGPAFVFMFIEALADGGVRCGLPRDKALFLAEQTVLGSAKLAMLSDCHPEELKDAVCSPGGTTIEGVIELEKGAFRADSINAVVAAYEKTKALSR